MSIKRIACGLSTIVLIGCHQAPPATPPSPPPAAAPHDPTSLGEYMSEVRKCGRVVTPSQQLGCVLPEFGGAHIDSTGTLDVFITDLRILPRARRILHYQLELQKRSQLPVRFVQGDYSFQQMESAIKQLFPYLGPGVASVGIDEWVNRIRITYVTDDGRARMEDAIRKLRLPRKAIILEKGAYAKVVEVPATPGISTYRFEEDNGKDTKHGHLSLVRQSGGGSGEVLHRHLQEFEHP